MALPIYCQTRWFWGILFGFGLCFTFSILRSRTVTSTSAPLLQQAYIWQRVWTKETRDAATSHGADFDRLVVLKTEVSWSAGQPQVAQVPLDFPALVAAKRPVGLALRIGPPGRRILNDKKTSALLIELAVAGLRDAQKNGLEPVELQVDFDCPQSQLDDYVKWIAILKQSLAPVPVTITALPCWLDHASFSKIAKLTPNYVLQVHSLECPANKATIKPLCDTQKTRAWITKAAQVGIPFRVALPTCGYRVAFDRSNACFVGLMAEGPARNWPANIESCELSPSSDAMAELIREWAISHPKLLSGIIWYRLPVATDSLNWSWPTLKAVMQGRSPSPRVETEIVQGGDGLFEVHLLNKGEAESQGTVQVKIDWEGREVQTGSPELGSGIDYPLASEVLNSFESISSIKHQLVWKGTCRLKPGGRQTVGWVRLARESEIRAHVTPDPL